jgi:hypothetical protein
MAKGAAGTITKSSRRVSRTSFRAIKKRAKERAAEEKGSSKVSALTGREARSQERFRELVAWYMLHGVDEATARRRAQDEMDDDRRKD